MTKTPAEIFAASTSKAYQLRRALIEDGIPYVCAVSNDHTDVWMGRPLVLQIDHVDGNHSNNAKSNLRFLCPNCHTQTNTYGNQSSYRCQCGRKIRKASTRCRACTSLMNRDGRYHKIAWPELAELEAMYAHGGYVGAGRKLGVSDTAVKKALHRMRQREHRAPVAQRTE